MTPLSLEATLPLLNTFVTGGLPLWVPFREYISSSLDFLTRFHDVQSSLSMASSRSISESVIGLAGEYRWGKLPMSWLPYQLENGLSLPSFSLSNLRKKLSSENKF